MSYNFSKFPNILETKNSITTNIGELLEEIKSDKNKEKVLKIRNEKDKEKRNILKMSLEAITFSGIFQQRKEAGLVEKSGIICLDFDNLENPEEKKKELSKDPYIFCVFTSPSGNGLKALILYNREANHKKIFEKINEKFPEIDKSGKDICRVCYTSYDPDLYFDLTDKLVWFDEYKDLKPYTPPKKTLAFTTTGEVDRDTTLRNLLVWSAKKFPTNIEGSRNTNCFILSCALFNFGFFNEEIRNIIKSQTTIESDQEINNLVNSADKTTKDTQGTLKFEKRPYSKQSKEQILEIKEERVKEIEEYKQKETLELPVFWQEDINATTPKLKIKHNDFYDALSSIGYRHYQKDNQTDINFCLIKNNIVYVKTILEIKNEVKELILNSSYNRKEEVLELVVKSDSKLYSKETMGYLQALDLNKNLKTNTKISYQFFKNCVIRLQKGQAIKTLNYEDLDGFVWDYQIKKRNLKLNQDLNSIEKSQIYQFINNTQDKNTEKTTNFLKTIGYLVKGYHSVIERKIVCFVDGNNTDPTKNSGGRGKTFFLRDIINQYTPTTMINTSHGDLAEDRFWLSSYREGDRVIVFNDLDGRKTDLRQFYTLTDGFEVERKGKDRIILRDEEVPAVVITCNHLPKFNPTESSSIRRLHIVEFSDYYGLERTPFEEFNCELGKWEETSEQWSLLDNLMIFCLNLYLEEGLAKQDNTESIKTSLECQIGTERVEVLEILTKDKNEIELDTEFLEKFNYHLGFNPESTDWMERKNLIDKKHLEKIFSLFATFNNFQKVNDIFPKEIVNGRSITRRVKVYKKV